jgi:hypothetical protein
MLGITTVPAAATCVSAGPVLAPAAGGADAGGKEAAGAGCLAGCVWGAAEATEPER